MLIGNLLDDTQCSHTLDALERSADFQMRRVLELHECVLFSEEKAQAKDLTAWSF